jgi:hypothetical protein
MKTIYFLCVCIIFFSFVQSASASLIKNEAKVYATNSVVSNNDGESLENGIIGAGLVNVPEPATLFLLGSGLISFAAGARRKIKQR